MEHKLKTTGLYILHGKEWNIAPWNTELNSNNLYIINILTYAYLISWADYSSSAFTGELIKIVLS